METITNKSKEHARLSMAILRAKRSGKDQEAINQLLAQREQLKLLPRKRVIKNITNITQKNITKIKTDKNNYQPLTQISNQLTTLLNQIKKVEEQNNLFHYELTEYFQEKENQQLRISQLEQTISELQSQNQTLIKTISEKKSESKTKEKNTIKKLILTPQLRKQLKKETINMVK